MAHTASALSSFYDSFVTGKIELIDLTQTLSEDFPTLQLPPEFGQAWPFRQERISEYDARGPGWYWNNFSLSEHTGTHFDAPAHWITGKDRANNSVDTLPVKDFVAPAFVVDCSQEVRTNPDWLLTPDYLQAWERRHAKIEPHSWLLFRTDWSKRRMPEEFTNFRADGPHTPGPSQPAVEWLIKERDVLGFGVETINTDAGQSYRWPLPYPCHTLMHGAGRYGLQCLKNLDVLPPTGALIIAAPLKLKNGSGSPLRVLALVAR